MTILICAVAMFFSWTMMVRKANACTCIVVGKDVSSTGKIIVGHNEDDGGLSVVLRHIVPPSENINNDLLNFEPLRATLPVPSKTLGYMWSQVRGVKGFSGADCFYNDEGVFIASDNCSGSKRDNEPDLEKGGIVYGLRHLLACQATSARHGVEIACQLLDTYGYGDPGRCYTIADKEEAWMLQTTKGKHYCAKRIGDDQVAFIPNHYTIRDINPDDPNVILSKGFVEYATKKGWYDGSYPKIDFAKTVQDEKVWLKEGNTWRHRKALKLITGKDWGLSESLIFSVKPEGQMTVDRVKEILRSHYEGTEEDVRGTLDMSPHFTKVRRICTGTTLESIIVQFRETPALSTIWTVQGHPCSSPFVPWYGGIIGIPEEFTCESPQVALKKHFDLKPEDMAYDEESPWWKIQDFQCLLDGQYDSEIPRIAEHIKEIEKIWEKDDIETVEKAQSMMEEDPESGKLYLTSQTAKKARESIDIITYAKEKLLPQISISTDIEEIDENDRSGEIEVTIKMAEGEPIENSMIFGQEMQKNETWATPIKGSLKKENNSTWTVRFRTREMTETCCPCKSRFWLYGKNSQNSAIVGKVTLRIIAEEKP